MFLRASERILRVVTAENLIPLQTSKIKEEPAQKTIEEGLIEEPKKEVEEIVLEESPKEEKDLSKSTFRIKV